MSQADGFRFGAHFTHTRWGNVLIGPTARYIEDKNDYERNRVTTQEFARSTKLLLPEIDAADLVPAHFRIRANLVPPPNSHSAKPHTKGMADFIIERDPEFPNVVQLIGIESPGLTSAPAIAEQVGELVNEILA
jgi:glycerol-3-phosphate dehydrogenase